MEELRTDIHIENRFAFLLLEQREQRVLFHSLLFILRIQTANALSRKLSSVSRERSFGFRTSTTGSETVLPS